MAGGVLDAAVLNWHKSGRLPSTGKEDYTPRPTCQPGSFPLDVVHYSNIAKGVRQYLHDGATWMEAYDLFLEAFYPAGERIIGVTKIVETLPVGQRPSFDQFKWHGSRLVPHQERLELQFGERTVQTSHRGRPHGQSAYAIYPGVVGEIDWTYTDVIGVSRGTRLSIGRFVFYAIADVHSGYVTSAYATMHSGTAAEAGKAIVQCLEDKVALCGRYGITITEAMWGIRTLFAELRSDRGEINSWKSTGIGTSLGMKLEYCPSKRPDTKGTIESFFRILRYLLRRLRGGTSGHPERLKDHPNVTAIYDFDQVQALLLQLAVTFNARVRKRQALTPGMVASRILPVPNQIMKWASDRGCLREFSLESARIGALPTHFASITAEGIQIKGLRFVLQDHQPTTTEGIDANDWLMRALKERWKVEIGIEPSTVNYVWLRHRPRSGVPVSIMCPLSAEHEGWRDFSWIEYGLNNEEYKSAIKAYEEKELREIKAWGRAQQDKITKKAAAETAVAREGMSASAQIAGTEARRRLEMEGPAEAPILSEIGSPFFNDEQWGASN